MSRAETSRTKGTVSATNNVSIATNGKPFIAVEVVTATASPVVKVQGDFGSGTVRSIRCYHLGGASTETSVDPDTSTAALAAQDVILIPTLGAENIQITYVSGTSAVLGCTANATDALVTWLIMKLIDGGITASSNTEYADDGTGFTLATSKATAVGGVAKETDGTDPGSVTEDDFTVVRADRNGRMFVSNVHPNSWSASVDYASAQTNATVKAAPGAGLKLYITDIFCSNGATAGNITLLDGSGGTVVWEQYVGIEGGSTKTWSQPIFLTAATGLFVTSTLVDDHSLTVSGYIAP